MTPRPEFPCRTWREPPIPSRCPCRVCAASRQNLCGAGDGWRRTGAAARFRPAGQSVRRACIRARSQPVNSSLGCGPRDPPPPSRPGRAPARYRCHWPRSVSGFRSRSHPPSRGIYGFLALALATVSKSILRPPGGQLKTSNTYSKWIAQNHSPSGGATSMRNLYSIVKFLSWVRFFDCRHRPKLGASNPRNPRLISASDIALYLTPRGPPPPPASPR